MKIIPQSWETIEALEQAAREKTGDPLAGFNADKFFFSGKSFMIPILYRKKSKKGFTEKYFELQVVAKFCPFTEKPLYEDEEPV